MRGILCWGLLIVAFIVETYDLLKSMFQEFTQLIRAQIRKD